MNIVPLPDVSDIIVCPTSDCDTDTHFLCRDNRTCIHNSLLCDGHEQCLDGSDEDEYCSVCPLAPRHTRQVQPVIGHPPRRATEWRANTFRCKHRDDKLENYLCHGKRRQVPKTGMLLTGFSHEWVNT